LLAVDLKENRRFGSGVASRCPQVVGVSEEGDEVIRLRLEVESVKSPRGKGAVSHPVVAVVPVSLTTGVLGQRCGGGSEEGPGGPIGEGFQRESTALEVFSPWMVGESAAIQPSTPELRGFSKEGV